MIADLIGIGAGEEAARLGEVDVALRRQLARGQIARAFAEQARLSRQLVELRRDLPLAVDWDAARIGQWDAPRLQELFREFGFRRFGDELRQLDGGAQRPAAAAPAPSHSDESAQNGPLLA